MEQINLEQFEHHIENTEQFVVVFSASWCGPCKVLATMFEDEKYADSLPVFKIDAEQETELSTVFSVRSIPAIFKIKDGITIDNFVGLPSQEQLEGFLKND
jgi:thioredoxin-like negative regulator of GroEL